jgi:hypothetical protein
METDPVSSLQNIVQWKMLKNTVILRRVTVDEIAKQLNISTESAYSVMHDNLQFQKVCGKWAPKQLIDEHKHMRLAPRHVPAILLVIAKKVTSSSLSSRNQVEEHAMEAYAISSCKRIQEATIGRQVDVDHLL